MRSQHLGFWVGILAAFLGVLLSPVKAEMRKWTSTVGTTLEAEYVSSDGEEAILKKSDGKTLTVKLVQLSEADREFISSQELLAEGEVQEVLARPEVIEAYLGT